MINTHNKTKIVATYGPACEDPEVMLQMIDYGVDVIRFNFSHGSHDFHHKGFHTIKDLNKKNKTKIAILADLQGPKIRVGEVENNGILLEKGFVTTVTTIKSLSTLQSIYVSYENLAKDVRPGEFLLVDDGRIKLKVLETDGMNTLKIEVEEGGILSSKKGVNLPNTKTTVPSLTEKDKADLDFAIWHRANWIALSFVRKPEDVIQLKEYLGEKNSYIKVIAKIEKPEAIDCLDEIIEVSDGIMVARGDLAVEVPMETVPIIQKNIVNKCIAKGKPVIIATQMMDSMIEHSMPTRAEITDVANAVLDGADALMLSGETSVGKYPVKVIESMSKIIHNVESQSDIYHKEISADKNSETFLSDAVCLNACQIAKSIGAKAILGMTRSGYTAFRVSSYRPQAGIYIFTDNKPLLYTLSLIWGVHGFYYQGFQGTDETINDIIEILKQENIVAKGDIVVNTASMPLFEKARTNTVKVSVVKDLENHKTIIYDNVY